MKQTRRLEIEQKVFGIRDLKRLSEIFDKQKQIADEAGQHYSLEYSISFEDKTSFESDSSSIFDDGSIIDMKRPVDVNFRFYNYTLGRRIDLQLTHGSSGYRNGLIVSGENGSWVNDGFISLKERIDSVQPQGFWLSKHPLALMNITALGIGSLVMLIINWLVYLALSEAPFTIALSPESIDIINALQSSYGMLFYMLGWLLRWILGYMWGAHELSKWFLKAWPSIELDFGAEHLKKEKRVRERAATLVSLVIVPILITIGFDLAKRYLYKM